VNHYEQKIEAKRERLEARAERLQAQGDARMKSGMDRLKAIPFGQPILIGHHSEGRDRNYRRKAVGAIDKGMELRKQAGELAARAASVGTGGISSDDPDAIVKLKVEIEAAEALQAKMIAGNKIVRKFFKASQTERVAAAMAAGFSEAAAAALFEPDCMGALGFPSYRMTNNGANIRRMKQRIEQLTRNATRVTKEEELPGGIRIVENAEANRVQLFFPGKPSGDVRSQLKASGFRWSPMEGAWQRHLTASAVYWARDLVKKLVATP
jgi:hypothetical protein